MRFSLFVLLSFLILQTNISVAQQDSIKSKPFYFYKAYKYGTQGVYNPLTLVLNAGFDIYQLEEHNRQLFIFPYGKSAYNTFWNLGHPKLVIDEIGWWNFIGSEIIPTSFDSKKGQWVPNYFLHTIGGGMTYRMMTEWYRYHKVKYPEIYSFTTVMGTFLLNEIIENNGYTGHNSDAIPDVYIFNLAGVALFSSEKVSKFFSEKLNMADWSLQPSITLTDFALHNNGQYFSFKLPLFFKQRLSLFIRLGMGSLAGASWKFNNGTALSLGAGVRSGSRYLTDIKGRQVSITTPFSIGIFYDKNNSLLASVQVSNVSDYFICANVYPGLLNIGGFSPGLWANFDMRGYPTLGITTRYTLGAGLGYNFRKPL
ncbi:MAG: hypothetical protein POELPBGB_03911 [Bacteroidia bacterium]|nr:hypothetical protein [Bacteroidia bacterium]